MRPLDFPENVPLAKKTQRPRYFEIRVCHSPTARQLRLVPFDPNGTLGGAVRLDSTQRPGIICRGNHQRPRWRLLCVIE